jgi:hypothetical protein
MHVGLAGEAVVSDQGDLNSSSPLEAAVSAAAEVPPEAKADLVATIVQQLAPTQQQQAAAATARALPPQAKADLVATIVQQLDSDQQEEAVTAAVAALPTEAMPGMVATIVQALDTPQQRAAAEIVMDALPADQDRVTTEAGERVPAESLEPAAIVRLIVKVLGADIRQLHEIAIRRGMTVTDALRQCITAQSWIDQQKHSNSSFIVEDSRGNRRRVVFP